MEDGRIHLLYTRALVVAAICVCVAGCLGGRVAEKEEHYLPPQVAEFYLDNLSSPPMEPAIYRCLTASARERVPFASFTASLPSLRAPGGGAGASPWRVTIVDRIDISDSRSIVYAMLRGGGPRDDFLLARVDCRLEGGEWRIELPSSGGSFRPVDILLSGESLDGKSLAGVDEIIEADRTVIENDIQRRKSGEEMRAAFRARDESLADLIILGKGCYNSGHYRKAMMAFGKALRLDPENALAREYMEKCRQDLTRE